MYPGERPLRAYLQPIDDILSDPRTREVVVNRPGDQRITGDAKHLEIRSIKARGPDHLQIALRARRPYIRDQKINAHGRARCCATIRMRERVNQDEN